MRKVSFLKILCALLLIAGCAYAFLSQYGVHYIRAVPEDFDGRSGDVLLLGSSSLRGRLLKILDRESNYVHVGILEMDGEEVLVVHADPQRDEVLREPLSTYLLLNNAERMAVLRIKSHERQREKAVAYALTQWREKRPFDNSFSYCEGDGFYCTELVLRAWSYAGVDLLPGIEKGDKILPSELLDSDRIESMTEFMGIPKDSTSE